MRQRSKPPASSPAPGQIKFINALLRYGRKKLGLNFAGSFRKFDDSKKSANWLYVSRAHIIESVIRYRSRPLPFKFSWDRSHLVRSAAAYRRSGHDTYLFSAEGHGGGNCPVTPALLLSSLARQAYVVIHEGWHSTLGRKHIRLPYPLEEATGRVVGCFGAIEFAREQGDVELAAEAVNQEKDWAAFARFVNRWHGRLSRLYAGGQTRIKTRKRALLREAFKEAGRLREKMKTYWESKELEADMNNAFFLRYYDYTRYYPDAAKVARSAENLAQAAEVFKTFGSEDNPIHALKQLARQC